MDYTKELTHISLCAGYGGIDIGLKRALGNVRTIAFSEIEAYAVANLVTKMEEGFMDTAPIWTDLKTFPWEDFKGKVDILSGGFPCQPFSTAGRRAGDDDPRHLWPNIVKGIQQLGKPPIIFLENVQGIISSKLKSNGWNDPKDTPVLLHVLRELERLDYRATAGLFTVAEIGAPHQRKRVFILAVSKQLKSSGYELVKNSLNREEKGHLKNSKQRSIQSYYSKEHTTAFPNFRGEHQYKWEAPRVTAKKNELVNPQCSRLQASGHQSRINNKKTHEKQTRKSTNTSFQELEHTHIKRLERQIPQGEPRKKPKEFITGSSTHEHIQGLSQSKVGRAVDGVACRVGTSELFNDYDNRTDELRLLGNGVVPDTAKRAFKTLWAELAYTYK